MTTETDGLKWTSASLCVCVCFLFTFLFNCKMAQLISCLSHIVVSFLSIFVLAFEWLRKNSWRSTLMRASFIAMSQKCMKSFLVLIVKIFHLTFLCCTRERKWCAKLFTENVYFLLVCCIIVEEGIWWMCVMIYLVPIWKQTISIDITMYAWKHTDIFIAFLDSWTRLTMNRSVCVSFECENEMEKKRQWNWMERKNTICNGTFFKSFAFHFYFRFVSDNGKKINLLVTADFHFSEMWILFQDFHLNYLEFQFMTDKWLHQVNFVCEFVNLRLHNRTRQISVQTFDWKCVII